MHLSGFPLNQLVTRREGRGPQGAWQSSTIKEPVILQYESSPGPCFSRHRNFWESEEMDLSIEGKTKVR
jgi:hypothetical protein